MKSPSVPLSTLCRVGTQCYAEDGHFERVPVPRLIAVTEYNKYMGGVDAPGQMLETNLVHLKTKRWNMSFPASFGHCSDSFILHKKLCTSKLLAAQLLGVRLDARPEPPNRGHFPVPTSTAHMAKSKRASMGRKQERSTSWKCQQCKENDTAHKLYYSQ